MEERKSQEESLNVEAKVINQKFEDKKNNEKMKSSISANETNKKLNSRKYKKGFDISKLLTNDEIFDK